MVLLVGDAAGGVVDSRLAPRRRLAEAAAEAAARSERGGLAAPRSPLPPAAAAATIPVLALDGDVEHRPHRLHGPRDVEAGTFLLCVPSTVAGPAQRLRRRDAVGVHNHDQVKAGVAVRLVALVVVDCSLEPVSADGVEGGGGLGTRLALDARQGESIERLVDVDGRPRCREQFALKDEISILAQWPCAG